MRTRPAALLACCLIAAASAQSVPTSSPTTAPATTRADLPTPAQIVAKYVDATGGAAAYASIKSRRATGTFALPDLGINGTLEVLIRSDGNAKITIDVPGLGLIQQGMTPDLVWSMQPTEGPKIITGPDAQTTRRSFSIAPEISLDGYATQKTTGIENVNGQPAYVVELVSDEGTTETRYYDVATSLLVKSVGTVKNANGSLTVTTQYQDYEDAAPIRMAKKVRQSMSGVSPEQTLTKVEHNVELPDALFRPPAEIEALRAAQKAPR